MLLLDHYTTTETAAFVRAALRAAFPGTRFSVRSESFSMGSVVRIGWTDGPTEAEVRRVAHAFSSRTFDGSDDSTHFHTHTVDGRTVQYSGWITYSRHHSPELRALAERRAALTGEEYWPVISSLRPNGCRVRLKDTPAF